MNPHRTPIESILLDLARWTLIALGLFGLVAPAGAAELPGGVRLTLADDLVSGNDHPDDLYTAELRLDVPVGGRTVRLGERMFTRRELGRRFDETYLDVDLFRGVVAAWELEARAGLQRTGHGLLGVSAQNRIHRVVGSEAVHLEYVDDDDWYATAALTASRELSGGGRTLAWTRVEAYAAPGFRQWVRGGLVAERAFANGLVVRGGAGLMWNRTQNELLAGAVARSAPTAEIGVARDRWSLRWTYNDAGTKAGAVTLGVRLGAAEAGGGPFGR